MSEQIAQQVTRLIDRALQLYTKSDDRRTNRQQAKRDLTDMLKEKNPVLAKHVENLDRVAVTLGNTLNVWNENFPGPSPIDAIYYGAHLVVRRAAYTHHGLYKGDREVLHYAKGHIHTISLDDFIQDAEWAVVETPVLYDSDEVVDRGMSRFGEQDYNLVYNNCEHFVRWCRGGGR